MTINRLVFILLFVPSLAFAQDERADSLISEYNKIRDLAVDSTLGNALYEIAQYYEEINQYELANSYYKQSLSKYKKGKLAKKRFFVFKRLGTIDLMQGKYHLALSNYQVCLDLANLMEDTVAMGSAYHNMAIAYSGINDFPMALDFYQKALSVQQLLGNKKREAYTIGSIGSLYNAIQQTEKAMRYYHEALQVLESIDDKSGIAIFTTHLANIYKQNRNYGKALELYHHALDIQKEVKNQDVVVSCLSEIGDVFSALGNYEKSRDYYNQAIGIAKTIGNETILVKNYDGLAKVAMETNKIEEALKYAKQAVRIADKQNILIDRKEAHFMLSEVYEKKGNSLLALQHFKTHITLKDSIFNENSSLRLARLESEFNFEKERERIMLEKERNELAYELKLKQGDVVRNIILASLIIGLGCGFFIYKNYRVRGKVNVLLKERNFRISDQNKKITKQNDELNYTNMQLIEARMDMLEALDNERKAHESLKEAEKQLVQSEKMASLGQLTAGIAHEINNPLNYITGSIQVIEENLKILEEDLKPLRAIDLASLPSEIQIKIEKLNHIINEEELLFDMRDMLPSIQEGADKIKRIVDSLKVFASDGAEVLQEGNIHADLDATIALVGATWQKNIHIKTYYDHNIPNFYGYHGLINQMLLQLMTNSVDSIEGDGELRIYTELFNNAELEIRIQDTGKGIPAEVRDKVFDPFFTTKDVGKGAGLGLAQVYSIVQKHNGSIRFITTENIGTTFFIKLPLVQ